MKEKIEMIGYIYKITNSINQKSYIGKTVQTIEKRWKEHIKDSRKYVNRPLYRAFNKYGIENFSIDLIEEVDIRELSNKEIYWIEYYHTYSNGYNATLGGDGKILYDYDLIAQLIQNGLTSKEISKEIGCSLDIIHLVANKYNLSINSVNLFTQKSKKVQQYDKYGILINEFNSYAEAARWLEDNNYVTGNLNGVRSHIGDVCKGKRKTAYGFKWQNI